MEYLTAEDILLIHSIIVDETSGSHGVREIEAIKGIADAPKQAVGGNDLYATAFEKAAVYVREIIMQHPFIDGNKRTGVTAASIFLTQNGYEMIVQEGEIESLALSVVNEKLEIIDIAQWFEKHTQHIKD